MHYLPGARRVAGFLLMSLLAGCGGGGGGDEATRTEISTNAISFSAAAPDAPTPAPQVITATFGSDIAHLAVVHSGDAIATASSELSGRTAQITVTAATPSSVGPGSYIGAVAVTGYTCADATCTKLSAGSTATVAVSYQISPVVQLVTPYVAIAGVSNSVVIRGLGLRSFAVQGVRFGDTAATDVAVSTDGTLITATYPALSAGTYPVGLDSSTHQGAIPSTATLVVIDPITFAATTLTYPAGTTAVRRLIYDAERSALVAVTDAGAVARYVYAGGTWGAPTSVDASLRDAALSTNGTQLFGVTATALTPVDPVTLAVGTSIDAPSLPTDSFLKNIVVGHDNRGLITTGINSSTETMTYIYTPSASVVQQTGRNLNNATPGMSANGGFAMLVQGDPSLTTGPVALVYTAANTALDGATGITLNQNAIAPVVDRNFGRFVLNGQRVYAGDFNFLGTLPDTTAAVALKPDGTRAYAYNPAAGGILIYDISVDREEAAYEPLGAAVPLVADPGSNPQMIITPDGGTLFLAGAGGAIVIQPTPAG